MIPESRLTLRAVHDGEGVFTTRSVPACEPLIVFEGPRVASAEVFAAAAAGQGDGFLQIGPDAYLGLSGGLDDFVNHGCDPNCGLVFRDGAITLISLRPIAPHTELTFDYASTQNAFPFRFRCRCGSPHCRGEIGDFDELPETHRRYYREAGVLAPYLASGG